MKFDPINEILYTDGGELIKEMKCPYRIRWDQLSKSTTSSNRDCSVCDQVIIDTENKTDAEILSLIKDKPSTCFKVDLNQTNVRIIINDIF